MDEHKRRAIELGEAAGEEAALSAYQAGGIATLANTLQPSRSEGWAAAFYELWEGGPESWQQLAFEQQLAQKASVHPYYVKAFDEVFARGARRTAEQLVVGFLDARAGKPATDAAACRLGARTRPAVAYRTGHDLGLQKVAGG